MPLSRRTAGWRTTEETPPVPPSYPAILNTKPGQHQTTENRSPLAWITYFTQAGKATLWTTRWEPSVCLLPTFYLRCKTSRSSSARLAVHGLLLPLKTPFSLCSFSSFSLPSSSSLPCCFCSPKPFCTLNRGHLLRSLPLPPYVILSLSATVLGKHQHCTPVFHTNIYKHPHVGGRIGLLFGVYSSIL